MFHVRYDNVKHEAIKKIDKKICIVEAVYFS